MNEIKNKNSREVISREEYYNLLMEMTSIDMALLNCSTREDEVRIPEAIQRLRDYLEKTNWKCIELVRRPLEVLHILLLNRLYLNKKCPNPLNQYDLASMRVYATTEAEIRNLYAIYLNAIEASLIPQEA